MVWFLPIGTYDGIKDSSELTAAGAELADSSAGQHAVLRTANDVVTVPVEYAYLLEFLSTAAPLDVGLHQWIAEQADPEQATDDFRELAENGYVMSFGEYPLEDPKMTGRQVTKLATITVEVDDTASEADAYLKLVDAGRGKVLANEWIVDLVNTRADGSVDLQTFYADFKAAVPEDRAPFASQLFESGLKSLVQTGALSIALEE